MKEVVFSFFFLKDKIAFNKKKKKWKKKLKLAN